jgi:hypothetical protein
MRLEDVKIGLESMIEKYGMQKVIDNFYRMSGSKRG